MTDYRSALKAHHRASWGECTELGPPWLRPEETRLPELRLLVFRVKPVWIYATCGMSEGMADPVELERQYKIERGLEALEDRFEAKRLAYFDPKRRSVV